MINKKIGMLAHASLETLESLKDIDKLDKNEPLIAMIECDGYPSEFRPDDFIEVDLNAQPKTGDYVVVGYQDVGITTDKENGGYKRDLWVHTTIGKYEYIGLKGLNKYHIHNLDPDTDEPRLITNIDIVENKIIGVITAIHTPTGKINSDGYYMTESTPLRAWNK